MRNSNDPIGNRTRDLPACSAVPQPTTRQGLVINLQSQHYLIRTDRQTRPLPWTLMPNTVHKESIKSVFLVSKRWRYKVNKSIYKRKFFHNRRLLPAYVRNSLTRPDSFACTQETWDKLLRKGCPLLSPLWQSQLSHMFNVTLPRWCTKSQSNVAQSTHDTDLFSWYNFLG